MAARTHAPACDRQAIWTAIRTLHRGGGDLSVGAIRGELHGACPRRRILVYCAALTAAGILRRVDDSAEARIAPPARWHLIEDRGHEAPRVLPDGTPGLTTGREALWSALRVLARASLTQLLAIIGDTAPLGRDAAGVYLREWVRLGLIARHRGNGTESVYSMARSVAAAHRHPPQRRRRAEEDA